MSTATEATTRMKIYTKTGDEGSSCLYNMHRRAKDDATFDALGDVDECNVACGIAREYCVDAGNGLADEVRARVCVCARCVCRVARVRSRGGLTNTRVFVDRSCWRFKAGY
jgi:hypothetical protein